LKRCNYLLPWRPIVCLREKHDWSPVTNLSENRIS